MESKQKQSSFLFTSFILVTLLLNSLPVRTQDIVSTSDDVTNGSSVFVFRQSKAQQTRSSVKSKSTGQRTTAQRTESRKKIQQQVAVNQQAKPRQRSTPVTTPPKNGVKTATPAQASKVLAASAEIYLDQN